MFISRREYDNLQKQIEFWQQKAEREQKRADDLVDQVLVEGGRAPVSRPQVQEGQADMKKVAEAMFEQMSAAMSDGDGSDFIDENDMVQVAPEVLATIGGK